MGSIFKPKMPALPPPPAPVEPPEPELSPEEQAKIDKEQAAIERRRRGRKSTILTGPLGIQEDKLIFVTFVSYLVKIVRIGELSRPTEVRRMRVPPVFALLIGAVSASAPSSICLVRILLPILLFRVGTTLIN